MKKIIFISIAIVFAFTSCKKQLDLTPESAIGEKDFYQNANEVEAALVGCYDGLQNSIETEYVLCEIRSDNTTTILGEGEFKLIDYFMETPDNSITTNYWQICYNTIFRTNKVLQYLDVISDGPTRKRVEGEALFIRALNYFNLVRLFGNIPLVTDVILAEDKEKFANVSPDKTYDQIIADLEDAITLLPASNEGQFSRATSGAAKGLLAKVYVTLKQFDNALSLLKEVTLSDMYALQPTYPEVFDPEVNDEILFSIRFMSEAGGEGEVYSSEFTLTGVYGGLNNPTTEMMAGYEPSDSIRYIFSVTPDSLCGKYLSDANSGDAGNDWPVLRYADILLLLGETINELNGPTQEALDAINAVRERAGLPGYTSADIPTQEQYRSAMAQERIHELGFENHRWFDLLRTGKALEVMNAQGAKYGFHMDEHQLLFAIPQREIDVSEGYLVQNPGY